MSEATGAVKPIHQLPAHAADAEGGQKEVDAHTSAAAPADTFLLWRGQATHDAQDPTATLGQDADDGHPVPVTQMPDAVDPHASLHTQLGHIARQYLDVQRVRIACGNRDKRLVRDFGEFEALWSGIAAGEDYGSALQRSERILASRLERLVQKHFMADWVKATRGLGPLGFGLLIGVTGTLNYFPTVSKLWRYLGQSVESDGRAPRRKRGEKMHYSPQGRVLCHQIGDAIVKVGAGGPYRTAYDSKKAEYLLRERTGPSACPFGQEHKDKSGKVIACGDAHAHNAAMRKAVKDLLKDLWVEWHRRSPGELVRPKREAAAMHSL